MLANSTVNLTNSIVFSQGCHSGYSIVNSDAVPNVTQTLDWSEAFAKKGATLIAGTGYQYGDTNFLAYSGQLYADFAHALRLGTGPVAVGAALVQAKQTYLANTPNPQGIDIKSLLESTLYGLPMLSVNMPAGRIAQPTPTTPITPTSVGGLFGSLLGLKSADVTYTPAAHGDPQAADRPERQCPRHGHLPAGPERRRDDPRRADAAARRSTTSAPPTRCFAASAS